MNGPQQPDTTSKQADARAIAEDLPCFNCRYNLRWMQIDGVCPECGKEILDSLKHGWLQYSDLVWLRRLRTGIDLTFSLFLCIVPMFIVVFSHMILTIQFTGTGPSELVIFTSFCFGMLSFGFLWLIITVLLTTPDPGGHWRRAQFRRGPLAWWIVFLSVFHLLGMIPYTVPHLIMLMSGSGLDDSPEDLPRASFAAILAVASLGILATVALNASLILLIIHMRRIARRDPDGKLERLLSFNLWSWVVIVSLAALVFIAVAGTYALMNRSPGSPATVSTSPKDATKTVAPMPTLQPETTAAPTAARPPMPAFLLTLAIPVLIFLCLGIAWVIGLVISIFWFRRVLTRAINDNRPHLLPVVA